MTIIVRWCLTFLFELLYFFNHVNIVFSVKLNSSHISHKAANKNPTRGLETKYMYITYIHIRLFYIALDPCAHFCCKMVHCGYGTGALWDLWAHVWIHGQLYTIMGTNIDTHSVFHNCLIPNFASSMPPWLRVINQHRTPVGLLKEFDPGDVQFQLPHT